MPRVTASWNSPTTAPRRWAGVISAAYMGAIMAEMPTAMPMSTRAASRLAIPGRARVSPQPTAASSKAATIARRRPMPDDSGPAATAPRKAAPGRLATNSCCAVSDRANAGLITSNTPTMAPVL